MPSRLRRSTLWVAVVVSLTTATAVWLWQSGLRRGRRVGREVGGGIPGVGWLNLRAGWNGRVVTGRLLPEGMGQSLDLEVVHEGPDGRQVLHGAAWLDEALAKRELGWLEPPGQSGDRGGGWRSPEMTREVRFRVSPGSPILERRHRSGFSLFGWGASLRLTARWPASGSTASGWREAHEEVRTDVSDWIDRTRGEWRPEWWQGLRERQFSDEWEGVLEVATVWQDETMLSLHGTEYLYTGGAHGNQVNLTWNFVRRGDRTVPVGIGDIFREESGWRDLLTTEAVERLTEAGASWPKEGARVDVGRAFTLCPSGLHLYYDPYEVGSYAEGTYIVWVPWDRLEALLRPGPWRFGGPGNPPDESAVPRSRGR